MIPDGLESRQPIRLSYGNTLSAFWAIAWPAWSVSFVLTIGAVPSATALERPWLLWLPIQVFYFLGQAATTHRLIRRNYRYFWVEVIRDRFGPSRRLGWVEVLPVWGRIVLPQIAFLASINTVIWASGWAPTPEILQTTNSWLRLAAILVAGPLGVRWAVFDTYKGFHLQGFARPRWAKVPAIAQTD